MKQFKSMKRFKIIAVVLMLLISMQAIPSIVGAEVKDSDYIKSVKGLLSELYNGEISQKSQDATDMKDIFGNLDPYTTYFTKEEANKFQTSVSGNYQGIGVTIEKQKEFVVITKIFPGSPAELAGLVEGDRFVKIANHGVIGAKLETVPELIKGPEGSKVKIFVFRPGAKKLLSFEVQRKAININPVSYKIINGIATIKLDQFNANSYSGMAEALKEIDAKGINKIVLDLRNNPGGYLDQVVNIGRLLVPKGPIVKVDYKSDDFSDEVYSSDLASTKYKLVVLVNENSASASEILAGAIQDTKAGILVGTKSYGKAKVQSTFTLISEDAYNKYKNLIGDASPEYYTMSYLLNQKKMTIPTDAEIVGAAKITIGQYTTPNGRFIDGVGLQPDIAEPNYSLIDGIDVENIRTLKEKTKYSPDSQGIEIMTTEQILDLAGYGIDKPDIFYDTKSVYAIKKFQKDTGLYPTGIIDFSTQKALNKKLEALTLKIDTQLNIALGQLK